MTPRGEPISELDLHLFAEGKHLLIHDRLGAHRGGDGDGHGRRTEQAKHTR